MKKILFISFVLAGLFSCESSEVNDDQNQLTLVEAKGYYFEGDKKYKIYNGGIFRVNEVENFKTLFPSC